MLRSGAYSDEVVANLINRRFVPFWYDIAPPGKNAGDGWAYDAAAVEAIGPLDRVRRGRGGSQDRDGRVRADSYPAILIVTPDGERIGEELWGIHPPEKFVAFLKAFVAAHPDRFAPSDAERATLARARQQPRDPDAQLAAARLHWELAAFERCAATVDAIAADASGPVLAELLYLKGRSLLCLHRTGAAAEALDRAAELASAELAAAIRVARARADMQRGEFRAARERLEPLVTTDLDGRWVGAALYHAGLCHHRLDETAAAKKLWRRHRRELPYDRLARRSAASLGLPEAEAFLNQQLLETEGWW